MAEFDLLVKGGTIYDGSGGAPIEGDVAIRDGVVVAVGKVSGTATETIDATGRIVTPGFIDVHTHYDGQITWENRLAPSSNHGVTTVVAGNCGVGFAPCRPDRHAMLVDLMEGVEDVPEVVMTTGLPWNWETFPEYLDAIAARRLDIDVAVHVPHSAIRVHVMGERGAGREAPTAEDLAEMRRLTAEAVSAGAIGVSTSRNMLHRTKAGELAPSLFSEEDELMALAGGLKDAGTGVFQIIPEIVSDHETEFRLMRRLAEAAGRPLSFSLMQTAGDADAGWRKMLGWLDEAAADGLPMRAQVFPRPVGMLYGLDLSFHYFSLHPSFKPLLELPLDQKVAAMRDPAMKAKLLAESPEDPNPVSVKTVENSRFGFALDSRDPDYEPPADARIDKRAKAEGRTVAEIMYDVLLEDEGRRIIFVPGANYRDGNLDAAFEMMTHPRTILGLGDGGAHYGMICDASFPTFVLQRWVRDARPERKLSLPEAIAALSRQPALAVGLEDRGLLAPGYRADLNVIDLDALKLHSPTTVRDLPAGGRRLRQTAEGYVATVVAGEITYREGQPTEALPGRLVRGAQPAPTPAPERLAA